MLIAGGASAAAPAAAMELPAGFADERVAAVPLPTAMAFTPDGRLLAASQTGELWVVTQGGARRPAPALDLSARACSGSERGLLGVAVAPDFALSGHVFVYWSVKQDPACPGYGAGATSNRVSRFTMTGDTVDPGSELVLIDGIPNPGTIHNGGDLHVGPDGKLWISVGDGGCHYAAPGVCASRNRAAQELHALTGKLLRVELDGSTPGDNPYAATGAPCRAVGVQPSGLPCSEIWATGLRNPFRFAFDPDTAGRVFVNDVGWNVWEEVNEGVRGANYGWPDLEGRCLAGSRILCGNSWQRAPIHAYDHRTGCASITGGAFVPDGAWPGEYDDVYLFADYACGEIQALEPGASGGWTARAFATGLGSSSATTIVFGPSPRGQALYLATYAGGGEIRRIVASGSGGRPPVARLSADPSDGPVPLEVAFDGSASTEPDGDDLTYLWDFGDGTTRETAAAEVTHTYASPGSYTAALRVRDDDGTSAPATVTIEAGNRPPVPVIEAPAAGARFAADASIDLRGSATDPEDGPLPGTSLSWEVRRHHNEGLPNAHYHPWYSGTGATARILGPQPEDIPAAGNSYLEIRLTATDARGRQATVSRRLDPEAYELTVGSAPPGVALEVNERTVTETETFTAWRGQTFDVEAPATAPGPLTFTGWSDGGAAAHRFVMGAADATLTATYAGTPPPGERGLRATYFDNADLTSPKLKVVEPGLELGWGFGAPPGIGPDWWSARLEGSLLVPETGDYKLYALADDGVRLYLDGELVLSQWSRNWWRPEKTAWVRLDAGAHDLVVEYRERAWLAGIRVMWTGPGMPQKRVLGPEVLRPATER